MSAPAIKVDGAGKWYKLGSQRSPGALLYEQLGQALKSPARLLSGRRSAESATGAEDGIWAVRDISFELHKGEALGLVGRNGAGKSTLLKLLARITTPTHGRIELRGRVATLLEVGTGFHPDLTGRENIYLNGAILGMRRAEIVRKYDEIVEFSGVERFLETPVKRYSSGMFVRLGFAVAAHLDPDLLLVDEVLAVGDAEFQRKCLGKMRDVASEGRAVVFVSHNLAAVQRLCTRALYIDKGQLMMDGVPDAVVDRYLLDTGARRSGGISTIPDGIDRVGTGDARLRQVALLDESGHPIDQVHLGQPLRITATYEVLKPISNLTMEVAVSNTEGDLIATANTIDRGRPPFDLSPGWHELSAELSVTLAPHEFNLGIGLHGKGGDSVDWVDRAHGFKGLNVDESGADRYPWPGPRGYVRAESQFDVPREIDPPRPIRNGVETPSPAGGTA